MTTLDPPTPSTRDPLAIWPVPQPFRAIYAHAREAPAGRTLFVSGQFGVAPDGRMRAGFAGQLAQAMANVEALLAAAGMRLSDVAKATFILTRAVDLPALGETRRARWASDAPAAVTVFVAQALARPDALVEVEVTAVRRPANPDAAARPGGTTPGALRRIARWARLLARGARVDRPGDHGDWLLRDLGLDRSEVESPSERADERRRGFPYR